MTKAIDPVVDGEASGAMRCTSLAQRLEQLAGDKGLRRLGRLPLVRIACDAKVLALASADARPAARTECRLVGPRGGVAVRPSAYEEQLPWLWQVPQLAHSGSWWPGCLASSDIETL